MASTLEVAKGVISAAEKPVVGYEDIGKAAQNTIAPYPTFKLPRLSAEARLVQQAAYKWRINPVILWGVYGRETAHGSNIKSSRTGARGPFQFEPATAKVYGYPLGVNENGVTDLKAFLKQAEAAAHLLAVNGAQQAYKTHNNPQLRNRLLEESIAAYNTGKRTGTRPEYNLADVIAAGQGYSKAFSDSGREASANLEKEKGEAYPTKIEGGMLEKFGELGITLILILAGAILLIYGVAVAIRPRDKASLAAPKLGFGGSLGGLGG